jgi:hypothetical protein
MTEVIHVSVGDPPGSTGSASIDSYTCNCACQVCLSGSCCRFTQYPGTITTTTTGAVLPAECNPTDHNFAKLHPSKLFCRKCGVTKRVK